MSDLFMFFLNEATGDTAETADPVDSAKDDSNKDIAANKEDVSKDTADVENDSTEESDSAENATDDGSDTTDSSSTEPDQETPAVAGDNDDPDQAQIEDAKNKDKKLVLYRSLRDLKVAFIILSEFYEDLLRADIPSDSLEAVKLVKQKIDFNVTKLEELLTSPDIATSRTVADLTLLYNVYFGDMKVVDANLKLFVKTSKLLKGATKRSNG